MLHVDILHYMIIFCYVSKVDWYFNWLKIKTTSDILFVDKFHTAGMKGVRVIGTRYIPHIAAKTAGGDLFDLFRSETHGLFSYSCNLHRKYRRYNNFYWTYSRHYHRRKIHFIKFIYNVKSYFYSFKYGLTYSVLFGKILRNHMKVS